ncbi:uncharacterized protein LOC111079467 [Drosophila obscura]|nr:uncharacterized protein LOC111079467 [Drosophila obscura]
MLVYHKAIVMEDCEIIGMILEFIGDVLFGSDGNDDDYDSYDSNST